MTEASRTDRIIELTGELNSITQEEERAQRLFKRQGHIMTNNAIERRCTIFRLQKTLRRDRIRLVREFQSLTKCPTMQN